MRGKPPDHQKIFRELTNTGDALSSIFDNKSDLNEATNAFFIKLEEYIKRCFKKIRISDKPNKELDDLFSKRKELRNKSDDYSKIELAQVVGGFLKIKFWNFNTLANWYLKVPRSEN